MGLTDMMENFHHSSMSAHEKGEAIIQLLEEVVGELQAVGDSLKAEDDQDTFIPYVFNATLDGAGNGVVILERRPGYVLELVSLTAVGASVSSGILVYLNDQTAQNLLYAGTLSSFFSDQFQPGSIVPDGSKLIVQWVGAGAAANVTATLRGRKRLLDSGFKREVVA